MDPQSVLQSYIIQLTFLLCSQSLYTASPSFQFILNCTVTCYSPKKLALFPQHYSYVYRIQFHLLFLLATTTSLTPSHPSFAHVLVPYLCLYSRPFMVPGSRIKAGNCFCLLSTSPSGRSPRACSWCTSIYNSSLLWNKMSLRTKTAHK